MYNNTNPAELYSSTTWELISSDKYIRTGATALSTGGNNSISITKANLPNIKLKVDSFSLTTQPHSHTKAARSAVAGGNLGRFADNYTYEDNYAKSGSTTTGSGGGQNTGTASPNTETLGSGTALSIQPSYITLKFWKRLT